MTMAEWFGCIITSIIAFAVIIWLIIWDWRR